MAIQQYIVAVSDSHNSMGIVNRVISTSLNFFVLEKRT